MKIHTNGNETVDGERWWVAYFAYGMKDPTLTTAKIHGEKPYQQVHVDGSAYPQEIWILSRVEALMNLEWSADEGDRFVRIKPWAVGESQAEQTAPEPPVDAPAGSVV